jgi:multidrug efflux system membrane fusion protein
MGFLSGVPGHAAPTMAVDVRKPVQRAVAEAVNFTGQVEAMSTVELQPRVTGYLQKVHFKAGSQVKKGQLLFEIDARVYQAALDKAKAALALAEAVFTCRDAALQRARKLFAAKAISQEEFAKIVQDRTEAEVAVKLARVNVNRARLDLDFTRITAPIDGKISRSRLTPGNLVVGDTTRLATIVSEGPMYVYFDMDERTLLRYRRLLRESKGKEDKGPIYLGLANEKGYPHKATPDSLGVRLDPAKGTLPVRVLVPNADGIFMPGMFVRVRMQLGKPRSVLLVPEDAVASSKGKKYVLVVNNKNIVERREVTLGGQEEEWRIITEGLKPDEWVVVGGSKGLEPGKTVTPRRQPKDS